MTKDEMKEILTTLGWSQAELARRIQVRPGSVSRWKTVPGAVAAYLRLAVKTNNLLK